MTTTLTRIRCLTVAAATALFGAASSPALSADDFMVIHQENQKIGSAVSAHWASFAAPALAPDGFMPIHMANQMTNSAVAAYWTKQRSLAVAADLTDERD